jgi:hypothetical protein
MMATLSIPMRHTLTSRFVSLALLVVSLLTAGCASDPTAPTPTPLEQSLEVYAGPLDPGGTSTYLFTIGQTGTVQLMLAGVVLDNPIRSISPVMRLQISKWSGTECETLHQVDTVPRLTAALHAYLEPGSYCASVSDPGSLTEPVGVTLRIVAPALLRTGGDPGTATWTSTITPNGRATRTFVASAQGMASITLNSLSNGAVEAGIGIGVVATDGSGCKYAQIVRAIPGASPQLTTRVDAGDYCATIFDVGNFTANETFTMTIQYP